MIIYRDAITSVDLFSDAYKVEECYTCMYKIKGQMKTEKTGADDVNIGGNPSAEEETESYAESTKSGINVVLDNLLEEVTQDYDKKEYQKHLKEYMKNVAAYLGKEKPDRVADFKKEVSEFVKTVALGQYKEKQWQMFVGKERYDTEGNHGMIILVGWEEDNTIPTLYFFKDGLIEEKV